MASPVIRRQCIRTDDCAQAAVVQCMGCFQPLCDTHFLDHRRQLSTAMDMTIQNHHRLQGFCEEQRNEFIRHPLNQEIDQWESQSIVIIQAKANELREQLNRTTSFHHDNLSHRIRQLGEELRSSSEQRSFIETDLQHWRRSLEDLRDDILSLSTIRISGLKRNLPLKNIHVNIFEENEFFQYASNDTVRIEEYGRLAIHDASATETELRGRNEYTTGRHEIRFHLVQSTNNWMFLGINSKSAPLQNNSYAIRSACGWASNNNIWYNGEATSNTSTRIEMARNDMIILIIDCENRKILMTNERTHGHYELDVDVNICPFPWQFHVNLYDKNSSIRILST